MESSIGGEIFARYEGDDIAFAATAFVNDFDNFIYEADTGLEEDELPLFAYRQQDARYTGIELEASAIVYRGRDLDLSVDVVADAIRAELADGSPVPRIPPYRLLGGVEADWGALTARGEVEFVAEQDRVATFETPTDGFTMVNASLTWRPLGEDSEMLLILQGNNLFDVEARRHASFTKDFAPLAGRDIRATARLSF